MLSENIVTALYIAASVLFILSLGGLSGQESAKRAVWYGIVGMAIAVIGTIFGPAVTITSTLLPMLVIGAVIGAIVAMRVEMTGMPQLVAALHSFVGLAAVFIGINSDINRLKALQVPSLSFMKLRFLSVSLLGRSPLQVL